MNIQQIKILTLKDLDDYNKELKDEPDCVPETFEGLINLELGELTDNGNIIIGVDLETQSYTVTHHDVYSIPSYSQHKTPAIAIIHYLLVTPKRPIK